MNSNKPSVMLSFKRSSSSESQYLGTKQWKICKEFVEALVLPLSVGGKVVSSMVGSKVGNNVVVVG
jgi:hypothetical protein